MGEVSFEGGKRLTREHRVGRGRREDGKRDREVPGVEATGIGHRAKRSGGN
jgi:hypothetical protein